MTEPGRVKIQAKALIKYFRICANLEHKLAIWLDL